MNKTIPPAATAAIIALVVAVALVVGWRYLNGELKPASGSATASQTPERRGSAVRMPPRTAPINTSLE